MTQTIAELESQTGTTLDHRFPDLWPTTDALINACGAVFGAMTPVALDEVKPSEFVSRTLMARIITDLYALSTLAWRGYTMQAGALAASTMETCYVLAFIGLNDKIAKKWMRHKVEAKPFIDVYSSIENVIAHEGTHGTVPADIKQAADLEMIIYRHLCALKHGNPRYQRILGVHWEREHVLVRVGPQPGTAFENLTLWIIWNTLRNVLMAADAFARGHAPEPALRHWRAAVATLHPGMNSLRNQLDAVTEPDPHPA